MKLKISLVLVVAVFVLSGCSTLGSILRKYGYNELRPPTTLVPPGTIVEMLEEDPAILNTVCTQEESLGHHFAVPSSPTYNLDLVQAVSSSFNIDADYLKKIKADAKYKSIKNIKLSISNATVSQLSSGAVYASVVHRLHHCQRAIDDNLKDHKRISMITSTLKADVLYEVESDTEAAGGGEIPEELLKGLALKLGAQYSNIGRKKIIGEGLFWGIRNDQKLALLRSDRTISKTLITNLALREALPQTFINALTRGDADAGQLLGIKKEVSLTPPSSVVEIKK